MLLQVSGKGSRVDAVSGGEVHSLVIHLGSWLLIFYFRRFLRQVITGMVGFCLNEVKNK